MTGQTIHARLSRHFLLLACTQATLPSPSCHPAARLPVQNVPKVCFSGPRMAYSIRGLSRALLRTPLSRAGLGTRLRGRSSSLVGARTLWSQPGGSRGAMATAWLGTAPKIAWGFPFLVCREQGSSMGAGTRLPLFATQKGGGEEAAGKVLNPARSPGLWQGQATKEPPTFSPRGRDQVSSSEKTEAISYIWLWPTPPPPQATDRPRTGHGHALGTGSHTETNICCFISL